VEPSINEQPASREAGWQRKETIMGIYELGIYEYSNGQRPDGRVPRLYLAKGGEVRKFIGEDIPGFVEVLAASEHIEEPSHTDYSLRLAADVRPLEIHVSPDTVGEYLTPQSEIANLLVNPSCVIARKA